MKVFELMARHSHEQVVFCHDREKALKQAEGIYHILREVLQLAKAENLPTHQASNRVAERRIEAVARLKRMHVGHPPRRFRGQRFENH